MMGKVQSNRNKDNRNLIIKAVGDIAPGDCSVSGFGIGTMTKKYGCDFPHQKLGGILDGSDVLLGNLEGVLSHRRLKSSSRLCGLPEMAMALREVGFDIMSVANNHSFDYGPEVLNETIFHCKEAGLQVCGLRGNSDYYCQPVILEKDSVDIGILAYNWMGLENAGEMGEYISIVQDSVVNYTWNRNRMRDKESQALIREKNRNVMLDIKRLRKEVEILILMCHWGYEWSIYPPYGVVLEARAFVEAGADLIIGSHPHAPQGIEKYQNSLIAYSLGNFLWDEIADIVDFGMVLESKITPQKVERYEVRFVKRVRNFQPEPVSEIEFENYSRLINKSTEAILSEEAEQLLDDDVIYQEYERQYRKVKFQTFMCFLKNLPRHPFLFKPLLRKLQNFLEIIILRIRGKKVKW